MDVSYTHLDVYKRQTLSITVMEFEQTQIQSNQINIAAYPDSYEAGKELIRLFPREGLSYVLVLSDGIFVNGSELVRGMNESCLLYTSRCV